MIDDYIVSQISLENRVGVISGGSQGIGAGIVRILALAGAELHSFSRSGKTSESFEHPNVSYHSLDVTDSRAVKDKLEQLCSQHRLDFLVNNAGRTLKKVAQDLSGQEWQQIQDLNVSAAFQLCQHAYPFLKKSPTIGRIVNITSMAAHLGFSGVVPYCASKAGLLGLTRGLAVEWAQDNILVNSVAPGWIRTHMTEGVGGGGRMEKMLNRMALHRFGETEDIGKAVLFLVSDMGKYMSGQDIAVDGAGLCYGY